MSMQIALYPSFRNRGSPRDCESSGSCSTDPSVGFLSWIALSCSCMNLCYEYISAVVCLAMYAQEEEQVVWPNMG